MTIAGHADSFYLTAEEDEDDIILGRENPVAIMMNVEQEDKVLSVQDQECNSSKIHTSPASSLRSSSRIYSATTINNNNNDKNNKTKKVVQFISIPNEITSIISIVSCYDMTLEEKHLIWYNQSDYAIRRNQVQQIKQATICHHTNTIITCMDQAYTSCKRLACYLSIKDYYALLQNCSNPIQPILLVWGNDGSGIDIDIQEYPMDEMDKKVVIEDNNNNRNVDDMNTTTTTTSTTALRGLEKFISEKQKMERELAAMDRRKTIVQMSKNPHIPVHQLEQYSEECSRSSTLLARWYGELDAIVAQSIYHDDDNDKERNKNHYNINYHEHQDDHQQHDSSSSSGESNDSSKRNIDTASVLFPSYHLIAKDVVHLDTQAPHMTADTTSSSTSSHHHPLSSYHITSPNHGVIRCLT